MGMKHEDEVVALQAVEFWSTVCEEEVELAVEAQEVRLSFSFFQWAAQLTRTFDRRWSTVNNPKENLNILPGLPCPRSCLLYCSFSQNSKKMPMTMNGIYLWQLRHALASSQWPFRTQSYQLSYRLLRPISKQIIGTSVKPRLWLLVLF